MNVPNIWIGVGEYGRRALDEMSERLDMLRRIGEVERGGEPVFFHVPIGTGPHSTRVPSASTGVAGHDLGPEFGQVATAGALRDENRRGNQDRESPIVAVIAEATEMAAAGLGAESLAWAWATPADLQLGSSALVAIIGLNIRGLEGPLNDQARTLATALARRRDDVANPYRILLLEAPDAQTIPAIPLLFELMMRHPGNPLSSAGGRTALSALLLDEQHRPGSFAIRAFGIDYEHELAEARDAAARDLLRTLGGGDEDPVPVAIELPAIHIDMPGIVEPASIQPGRVEGAAPPMAWDWEPGTLESERDAVEVLRDDWSKLKLSMQSWREKLRDESLNIAGPAEQAAAARDAQQLAVSTYVERQWAAGFSPRAIALGLRPASATGNVSSGGASPRPVFPRERDLDAGYTRIRRALQLRPDPLRACLFIALLAGAAIFGAIAATALLSRVDGLSRLDNPTYRVPIVLLLTALVTWGALQTWIVNPRTAIRRASQQLANDATAERKEGITYQTHLKGGLQQLLTNDVTTATRHAVARASEQLAAAATAATGRQLGVQRPTGTNRNGTAPTEPGSARSNMYEREQQRMRGGRILPGHKPTAAEVRAAFRGGYLPIDLVSPNSALCYVPPECLADAVVSTSESCVRQKLGGGEPFVGFTIGLEDEVGGDPDDQVLHAFGADRVDEDTIFVPKGASIDHQPPLATDGGAAGGAPDRVRASLRLGDKAYWLVAAVVDPPDAPAVRPVTAATRRPRAPRAARA